METKQQQQQQQQYLNGNNEELDLYFPIMQQSTIYPLTADQVRNTVCEPETTFGSMDCMDDFLSSIWSSEEDNITMASAAATDAIPAINNIAIADTSANAPLQQQVSLAVPPPIFKKTVTEVWTDTHQNIQPISHPGSSSRQRNPDNVHNHKSEMEDMSLEDFLVKAGVVREAKQKRVKPPMTPVVQHLMIPEFQLPHTGLSMELPVHGIQQLGMVGSSLSPIKPDGFRVAHFTSNSGACGGAMMTSGSRSGRRGQGGADKVAERNQRMMIKNRESAARSRARKQAHTVELESEQNKLREENAHLREEVRLEKRKTADFMEERSREKTVKARRTHCSSVTV